MIGKVYNMPPQPPVPENTHYYPAGAITIGIEYRSLDPESLVATYKDNPAHLAELQEKSPAGGFTDEGVSLHICGADDGYEYLRFDIFESEPHYHYIRRGDPILNNWIEFDTVAMGDMLPWAIHCLRTRLPEMLTEAGGGHLVPQLDPVVIEPVIDQVAQIAAKVRGEQRALRAAG